MKKKIAILTYHSVVNYGAVLQCLALQNTIAKLGYDVNVLNYDSVYFKEYYSQNPFRKKTMKQKVVKIAHWILRPCRTYKEVIKKNKFKKFTKKHLKLSKIFTRNTIEKSNEYFDAFIVGSDQVWNSRLSNYDTTYFLDFVTKDRISYAASLGKKSITGFEYDLLKRELPKYKSISLRENEAKDLINELFKSNATQVLDPTLLMTKSEWETLLPQKTFKKKYLFIYLVQYPQKLIEYAFKYAEEHNLDVISFNYLKTNKKYKVLTTEDPLGLLTYINNAEIVFTTSFHGLIYSINFNKEFYYELSHKPVNMNSRLIDICKKLDINNRDVDVTNMNELNLDYDLINKKLDVLRQESISFLTEALRGE